MVILAAKLPVPLRPSCNKTNCNLRKETNYMKKQNVGFAFLLLGLIFAVTQETLFWWIGVLLGVVGFIIVLCNSKKDN